MRKVIQQICSTFFKRVVPVFLFFAFVSSQMQAQRVGLVLSGGGASGLAHIGVIKALEEYNIPIDYVTGTSMGAFIGALYAAGYTPTEMEKIVTSSEFQRIATGNIDSKFIYYFKQQSPEASWITFRFSFDTSLITSIPTHLVSPIPIDFALMQYFTGASFASNRSFDSLFVPFRCVAADIVEKKPHIFNAGNLGQAVRASISYPFYLKPLIIDGKMLFDGGLYNNFPTDIMQDNFHPDVILGSNVSGNIAPPTDDNILSEIKNMLMTKTNYTLDSKGMIITPNVEAGILTADHPKALIDSGYNATIRRIPDILKMIDRRVDTSHLAQRRKSFKAKERPLNFNSLTMEGLNSSQKKYIKSVLFGKKAAISLSEMEKRYYKVATDPDIHSVYPLASKKDTSGYYNFDVAVKQEKHFSASFGGVISNRPISEGYVGVQYSYLGKEELDLFGNTYFGKLYTSVLAASRIYFPTSLPFYLEPGIIYNRWDYFTSSTAFFEDIQPPYLIQNDQYGKLDLVFPLGMSTKFTMGGNLTNLVSTYYQSGVKYAANDTADKTEFDAITEYLKIETNTLNRKEYASAGTKISFQAQYVNGKEFYYPGSLDLSRQELVSNHEWAQLKFSFDNYYKQRGLLRLGIYAEGVYSYTLYPVKDNLQTYFTNYNSTILMAPSFQPTPESQTLFLPNFRAYNYVAGGPKLIVSFKPKIDLRFEGYIFLPYQAINNNNNLPVYGKPLATKHYMGVASVVYNSPIGPMSLSINYYDADPLNSLSILFHIGFIIFNPKSVN